MGIIWNTLLKIHVPTTIITREEDSHVHIAPEELTILQPLACQKIPQVLQYLKTRLLLPDALLFSSI